MRCGRQRSHDCQVVPQACLLCSCSMQIGRHRCCFGNRALRRVLTKESFRNSVVSVWNGAWWDGVTDGSKRCYGCGSHYKLNVVSERASRRNALQAPRDDSIVLITKDVGFRFAYLRQFWTRMCRASVSAEAEAATIMMVHPRAIIRGLRGKSAM